MRILIRLIALFFCVASVSCGERVATKATAAGQATADKAQAAAHPTPPTTKPWSDHAAATFEPESTFDQLPLGDPANQSSRSANSHFNIGP